VWWIRRLLPSRGSQGLEESSRTAASVCANIAEHERSAGFEVRASSLSVQRALRWAVLFTGRVRSGCISLSNRVTGTLWTRSWGAHWPWPPLDWASTLSMTEPLERTLQKATTAGSAQNIRRRHARCFLKQNSETVRDGVHRTDSNRARINWPVGTACSMAFSEC
jgi:hypothetical protein